MSVGQRGRIRVYGDPLKKMKKKMTQYTVARIISTPGSTKSFHSSSPPSVNENSIEDVTRSPIPLIRKKTAILSRRSTFNGQLPVDPKPKPNYQPKVRRPRRSVSDQGSLSSSSSSSSSTPYNGDSQYEQALHNLNHDIMWQKEVALGTRIGFYRLYRDLGKGSFSKVRVAVHYLTKEKVAIKIIEKSKLQPKTRRMLSEEIQTLEKVRHPHIIRLFEVMDSPTKMYLAMEYAEGGELYQRITNGGRLDEDVAKKIFAQITSAVTYLHKLNIVHRDLKAENIFMSGPERIKLGDFGFGTNVRGPCEALGTLYGSPPYAAPELFKKDCYSGPSADLWALGVLLYFMVTSSLPFKGDTLATIKKHVTNAHYTLPKYLSSECCALIGGLLQPDVMKRFSSNQIRVSPWLKGVSIPGPTNVKARTNSTTEKNAIKALNELGITIGMLKEYEDKGARSSIIGTHRIVLHRLEKGDSEVYQFNKEAFMKALTCPSFRSRACTIM